jgi:hypothetical protein
VLGRIGKRMEEWQERRFGVSGRRSLGPRDHPRTLRRMFQSHPIPSAVVSSTASVGVSSHPTLTMIPPTTHTKPLCRTTQKPHHHAFPPRYSP